MEKLNKKGVSPVIGVILMVAATIVVAAVVLGMLGGFGPPKKTYAVSATVTQINATAIKIVYQGGPDADLVTNLSYIVDGHPNPAGSLDHTPGAIVIINNASYIDAGPNNDAVTVTATFQDGSQQVILDTMI
ncbi:type IV pilin [Candidatus Alkanophaga liquidiphilum]